MKLFPRRAREEAFTALSEKTLPHGRVSESSHCGRYLEMRLLGLHFVEHFDAEKVVEADAENGGDHVAEEEAAHFEFLHAGF